MTEDAWVDREAFRSWLVAKDANATVGIAAHGGACPLANYAKEALGIADPMVTANGMRMRTGWAADRHRNPTWAHVFVQEIDFRFGGSLADLDRSKVTAKDALTLLDEIAAVTDGGA